MRSSHRWWWFCWKLKWYKEQVWLGQKNQFNLTNILPCMALTSVCSTNLLSCLSQSTHAWKVAHKVAKVSQATTSSRNFIMILSGSDLFGNMEVDVKGLGFFSLVELFQPSAITPKWHQNWYPLHFHQYRSSSLTWTPLLQWTFAVSEPSLQKAFTKPVKLPPDKANTHKTLVDSLMKCLHLTSWIALE